MDPHQGLKDLIPVDSIPITKDMGQSPVAMAHKG